MFDVVVIGGGPAGIMASIMAAKNGHKVLLLEKNNNLGKKLLLTGGGRCNLTNLKEIEQFLTDIPVNNKWLYSCLSNFGPKEIYSYFENLGIKLKVEDNDRVFPVSNKAFDILEVLLFELEKYKVKINYNEAVSNIILDDNLKIITTNKNNYKTKNVIVANGGLSYSITGSTGDGFYLAKKTGQPVTEIYPAETYLILKKKLPFSGITVSNVKIKFRGIEKEGSLLFTHKGISGPAVFKISEHVYKGLLQRELCFIYLDLIPHVDDFLSQLNDYEQKAEIKTFLRLFLAKSMVDYLIDVSLIDSSKKLATLSKVEKQLLLQLLKEFKLEIIKTGTLDEAFITGGGVDLRFINPSTMESKINKGLFFVGETLDVHGSTGGYNLTIAFATGHKAGISIK